MSVVETWDYESGTPSSAFTGGAGTVDAGNVLEFTGGKLHAQITGSATDTAVSNDNFGTDLTQGVVGIKNFTWTTQFTAGGVNDVVQILALTNVGFSQAVLLWVTRNNRLQFRIPGTGILNSAGITSPEASVALPDNVPCQIELAFKQNDYVQLYQDGVKVAEVTGLSGGTGNVRLLHFGFLAATAASAWTQTLQMYEDERKLDNDPTARPYSAAGGSNPAAPTGIVQVEADNATLKASVQFTTPTGYRLLYKAGANATPPTSPTDAGWTTIATVGTGSGQRTVEVTLPSNSTVYSIAVFSYDGTLYSTASAQCNAVALAPANIVAFTPTYVVAQIQMTLAGQAKLEINSGNTWAEGAADLLSVSTRGDNGSSWRLYGAAEDYTSLAAGAPLGSSTFPAASNGKYLRRDFPALSGSAFAKVYEGVVVP